MGTGELILLGKAKRVDATTTLILKSSRAKAKLLLDANVLIYAKEAFDATGTHLLSYLDQLSGVVDWYVGSCVVIKLHSAGTYDIGSLSPFILNCQAVDAKMNMFPYIKEDDSLEFVRLSSLAGDDWSQIVLAYNYPELIVATNDSAMFKTAHAVLNGRAIAFHNLLQNLSPYWFADTSWLRLKKWLIENKKPLRNSSSWIIPEQKEP